VIIADREESGSFRALPAQGVRMERLRIPFTYQGGVVSILKLDDSPFTLPRPAWLGS
jgi:hypothetical protein